MGPSATESVLSTKTIDALCEILPPQYVLLAGADKAPYLVDWRHQWHGSATAVVLPGSTKEVSAVVRACIATGAKVVPHGGNTSMSGGAVPVGDGNTVVVSLSRLNRIVDLDATAGTLTVEAGVTLGVVREHSDQAGKLFPLSIGSEGSCQIGGVISTNAGGTGVLRYGNTRDLVLGLEVVLPNGDIWDGMRSLRKDNSGYDLKHLFVGAEGTLGIVTGAVLKLFPRLVDTAMAWVAVRSVPSALALLAQAQATFDTRLTAFELLSWSQVELVLNGQSGTVNPLSVEYPWHLLIELSDPRADAGLSDLIVEFLSHMSEQGMVEDAAIAQNQRQCDAFWHIRHAVSDVNKAHGTGVTLDISVPITAVPRFIEDADDVVKEHFPRAQVLVVSHLGDGNVHYVVHYAQALWDTIRAPGEIRQQIFDRIHDVAANHSGSFSAELGIGVKLVGEVARYKSQVELDMLRAVKSAFDPEGRMNPGKLLTMAPSE